LIYAGRPGPAPGLARPLTACLLIALAAALIRSDTAAGLALKFALSKLVYSTSDGAILFLLGFTAIGFLCSRITVQRRSELLAAVLLGAGLTLGYGLHLFATVPYHLTHGIPFSAHVYHWAGGVNSYTALLHSHLGKAAMAPLPAWLAERYHYDIGGALAGVLPTWQLAGIALGFLAACGGALLRMPAFKRGYGHRPTLVVLFFVSAATATKSIFDGGLLAFAVPPSILLLATFVACPDDRAWSRFWMQKGWMVALGLLVGYGSLWIYLSTEAAPQVGAWLFLVVVMLLLMTPSWRGRWAWASRLTLLTYLWGNAYLDSNANLMPLLSAVGPGHRAAVFDPAGAAHAKAIAPWHGQPVFKLYLALGDDPWKPRKVLIWEAPAPGLQQMAVSVHLLDIARQQGQLLPTPSLRLSHIAPAGKEWIDMVFQSTADGLPPLLPFGMASVLSRNNYYVWLYQTDLLLRRAGWTSYILLPHTQGNIRAD